jgi:chemosensory pili system protein ChpA (sensor histidine kinase/response regulator)
MSVGGSTGFERLAILASFAAEIQPLLQVVASALDGLLERPGDRMAAQVALAELHTVRSAVRLLEVPAFETLLDTAAAAIEQLRDAPALSADQRAAGRALAELLLAEGRALAHGETAPESAERAAALVAQLHQTGVPATAASLDAWLDTLDAELLASPPTMAMPAVSLPASEAESAAAPVDGISSGRVEAAASSEPAAGPPVGEAVAPAAGDTAATWAASEADTSEIERPLALAREPASAAAAAPAGPPEPVTDAQRAVDPDATTEETLPPPLLRQLRAARDGAPPPTAATPPAEAAVPAPAPPGDAAHPLEEMPPSSEPPEATAPPAAVEPAPAVERAAAEQGAFLQALEALVGQEGLEQLAQPTTDDRTLALTPLARRLPEPPAAEEVGPGEEMTAPGAAAVADSGAAPTDATATAEPPPAPPAEPSPMLAYLERVSATVEALLGPVAEPSTSEPPPEERTSELEAAVAEPPTPADVAAPAARAPASEPPAGPEPLEAGGAEATTAPSIDEGEQAAAELLPAPAGEATPAGASSPAALAVFAAERQRLAERLHEAYAALAADPADESALTELAWAAHTLRGAAMLVGAQVLGEVCTLVEQVAERVEHAGLPVPAPALAFLANADETVQLLTGLPLTVPAPREPLELLCEQFAELERAAPAEESPAPTEPWGALPPAVAAQLEGVDLAALDDETVARLYALVDPAAVEAPAGQAEPEAMAAPPSSEPAAPELALAGEEVAWGWPPAPSTAEVRPVADEEMAAELRAVFAAEAEEHLATINQALVAFEASQDPAQLLEVRRAVHTLKGAAGAVGLDAVAQFCHAWEDVLDAVAEQGVAAPPLALLMDCAEALERYLREPAASDAAHFAPLLAQLRAALPAAPPGGDGTPVAEEPPAAAAPPELHLVPEVAAESWEPPAAEPLETPPVGPPAGGAREATAEPAAPADLLRVPLTRVDALIGLVGELVVQRSGVLQRLAALAAGLDDLTPSLQRLRRLSLEMEDRFGYATDAVEALAASARGAPVAASGPPRWATLVSGSAHEFDTLEFDRYSEAYQLARELGELAADLDTTRRELRHLLEEAQLAVEREGRVTAALHGELLDVRLVPLAQLAPRLQRTVRQAALKARKQVRFVLEGGDAPLDKSLLEEIADPLMHLLRNAVDHGIEPPAERERLGKDPTGTVTVRAARAGHEVIIQVCDDGAGIDAARVLARARERGLLGRDAPDDPALAYELIFAPGLSTSAEVTGLSGRGIGLDVVRSQIIRAKGTVSVSSTPGQGTVFTLRVPALLVVAPALVVLVGGQQVAVPLVHVRRVLRATPAQRMAVGQAEMLLLDDGARPLRGLGALLGWPSAAAADTPLLTALLVAAGDHEVALLVDDIVGQQEVVVKAPAPPFDILPGLAGASVQGTGEVLLVVNPLELLGGQPARAHPVHPAAPVAVAPEASGAPPTVLVVDDSLSVRRVVSRALERHGWRVREARDGLQALEIVRQEPPDVLLLDVEMPRMDGYELASILKKPGPYQAIPIVMLTSRAGEKHRRKALEIGVDAYLVKPYQEAELVRVLREVALATPWDAA